MKKIADVSKGDFPRFLDRSELDELCLLGGEMKMIPQNLRNPGGRPLVWLCFRLRRGISLPPNSTELRQVMKSKIISEETALPVMSQKKEKMNLLCLTNTAGHASKKRQPAEAPQKPRSAQDTGFGRAIEPVAMPAQLDDIALSRVLCE